MSLPSQHPAKETTFLLPQKPPPPCLFLPHQGQRFSLVFFWPHCEVGRILVPPPGIEPRPLALKAWSPNHWTAREFPLLISFFKLVFIGVWLALLIPNGIKVSPLHLLFKINLAFFKHQSMKALLCSRYFSIHIHICILSKFKMFFPVAPINILEAIFLEYHQ